jgi:signal transduction histidine kinase
VSDNIAHDLKTPLTRMRNRAEEALRAAKSETDYRAALERTIDESDALMRTFNALLMIARAESGHARDGMADFDAAEVVRGMAELYEPLAEEKGLTLKVEAPGPLTVHGNRELISQGEKARLAVSDNGAGIAEADRPRVVERFVRLEKSRSQPGSGLGLSLAAAVARLHAGELLLSDNHPGLKAVIALPRGGPIQSPG